MTDSKSLGATRIAAFPLRKKKVKSPIEDNDFHGIWLRLLQQIFDPGNNTMVKSRDAVFLENEFKL